MVRRREAQHVPQRRRSLLRGPLPPRRRDRHHLGGRRTRRREAHLLPRTPSGGEPHRQRAQGHGGAEGRRRHALHAHGPRARHDHAGVRAHRGGALGHLRGIQRRCHRGSDSRCRVEVGRDGERRQSGGEEFAAEVDLRCGDREGTVRGHRGEGAGVRREGGGWERVGERGGARSVYRCGGVSEAGVSLRMDGCGGSSFHSLYLWLDGSTERSDAFYGWICALCNAYYCQQLRTSPASWTIRSEF
mmetsp:Transcript_20415/g.44230  ORF Transcript_20415/g.44230 Transcript_20415/m.44230 type:complete len:245 (+) Transcript_20415:420-1154(+)